MRGRVKLGIELRISCSDTMLNYWLSQKLKLLGNDEFNHLTISLTVYFMNGLIDNDNRFVKKKNNSILEVSNTYQMAIDTSKIKIHEQNHAIA